MKITLKTLQQKTFTVVIDDSETVRTLKQRIETEHGPSFAVEGVKLIYAGKILNDSSKISEYNIQENNFVVVMVSKGKQPSKPQTTSTSSTSTPVTATTTASGTTSTVEPPQTQEATAETKPQQETTPTAGVVQSTTTVPPSEQTDSGEPRSSSLPPVPTDAASVLVTGSDFERAVANLMTMGFTREHALRAMHASYNNPDRAAEYLLEGKHELPPPEQEEVQQQQQHQPVEQESVEPQEMVQQQPVSAGGGAGSGDGSQRDNPLNFLLQTPSFQQLRGELARNPQILPLLLENIRRENPPLFEIISQNQEEFLSLINAPAGESGGEGGGQGEGSGMPGMGGAVGMPPGTISIQVNAQEKEAIDRLKALGFPEHLVIQAYFACDKNEALAANFLFSDKD